METGNGERFDLMKLEDFEILFNYLCKAYNKELDKGQLVVWYDFFKGYDPMGVKNAFIQAINEKSYMPSIAEIKELIVKQNNQELNLKGEAEWEKVLDSIHAYGYNQEDKALASLEPLTRNIVERIGFEELCKMDENRKYNYRSAFLKAFENEKQDILRYEKSNNKDSLEMQMIQERNKNTLNNIAIGLIKHIDDID